MPGKEALRVLVVEDDFFLADDIAAALKNAGAQVIGPLSRLEEAMQALARAAPDAAIVDIDLAGQSSLPLLEALQQRAVPILLSTGLDPEFIPEPFETFPRLEKPYSAERVAEWLGRAFEPPEGEAVTSSQPFANKLLNLIAPADMTRLRPFLSRVPLRTRAVLLRPNVPITRVYFPESGMCSMIAGTRDHIVETGIIGSEGMIGLPVLAGAASGPYQVIVQFEGEAIAVTASALQSALAASPNLASVFLKHLYVMLIQISHNALAMATATVEERLARWLLMCQDRVGDDLSIVHEFLSLMLHVRRPSVTLALQSLVAHGAISTGRGRLRIEDRDALLRLVGSNYGIVENEQRRILSKNA